MRSAAGVSKEYYGNLSNTIAPPVLKNSIWDKLDGESPETIAAMKEKASRVAPAYSKGSLQLIPKKEIQYAGRKS